MYDVAWAFMTAAPFVLALLMVAQGWHDRHSRAMCLFVACVCIIGGLGIGFLWGLDATRVIG